MEEYKPISENPQSPEETQHKNQAQTAMIFGIISAALAWFPLLSILSIIFGAMAVRRRNKNKEFADQKALRESGMNVAAFATGLVGIIAGAFMTLLYLIIVVFTIFVVVGVVNRGIACPWLCF